MKNTIEINDIEREINDIYINRIPKYIGFRVLPRIPVSINSLDGSWDLKRLLWETCMKYNASMKIAMKRKIRTRSGTKSLSIVVIRKIKPSKIHIITKIMGIKIW